MHYRRLGRSGLKVSELSLGSWVTYHQQIDARAAQPACQWSAEGQVP
jgi:aryl-alcohol dehydrogenase-like predicted oxidoreductase